MLLPGFYGGTWKAWRGYWSVSGLSFWWFASVRYGGGFGISQSSFGRSAGFILGAGANEVGLLDL